MANTLRHKLTFCTTLGALCLPLPSVAQSNGGEEGDLPQRSRYVDVQPYIEASQVLSAELTPGNDVVTYTQLAAGIDAGFGGRNSAGSLSLRYERRIGYGDVQDGDAISGIARTSLALVPRRLTFEAGALASRTRVESGGATAIGGFDVDDSSTSQVYSLYAGPTLQTNIDQLEVTGAYRIGYTRVEAPDAVVLAPGDQPVDIFDESLSQMAAVRAGFAPGAVLPVGVGVGAGWNRQDVSNLDQRLDDRHVRGDVTVPLSPTLALVGGVGYEEVQVSSRDAVRDVDGDPVIGPDGRFVTDNSQPRQIAYETDGLIWDAGVMWRPSRRTSLTATVGRRYGSMSYTGSFSYAPNPRTSVNVGVYNTISSFGGVVVDNLSGLPTEFQAFRNLLTGDLGGCVAALEGGSCALGNLGSLRSAVFRSRGVTASVGRSTGRTSYGLAGGYDQRRYIAAAGTALANVDGLLDETFWAGAYASQQLDQASGIAANASANWFDSGFDSSGSGMGYSASIAYYRDLFRGLTGTAAVGLDGVTREELPDYTNASALVGLRYSF
ncbi:preprotein translocase subunit YajC [Altererythrobacter sp. KTW20L]|uniref:preprotein translocase subunit YajC n=1 Tax=Altererythrobacter sp. KTW20L TaxID=2942210 RepID=UPI0020BDCFCA|nr:preprotein translocase subunit YajC [Altererythrobacter sp. KTW20L]MCL6251874.1 preprotein translocase subunit YajC [Altererythrobacter sp. KTW20L]